MLIRWWRIVSQSAVACRRGFLIAALVVFVTFASVANGRLTTTVYGYDASAPVVEAPQGVGSTTTTPTGDRRTAAAIESSSPRAATGDLRSVADRSRATKAGSGAARAVPTGLKDASPGLRGAFDGGSLRDRSIIGVRSALTENGFAPQQLAKNRRGYRFDGPNGEQVRIMRRGGGWDARVQNRYGNYLDEFGNVASPQNAHGITLRSR